MMDDSLVNIPETIYTPRLILTPMKADDAALVRDGLRESWADMQRFVTWAKDFDQPTEKMKTQIDTASQFKMFQSRTNFYMKAVARDSGDFVAALTLYGFNPEDRSIGAGYWTRTSYAGRGLTTEGMNGLIRYGFNVLSARRFHAFFPAGHAASRAVLEKLGFERERVTPGAMLMQSDGRVLDRYDYGLTDIRRMPALAVTWS